MKPTGTWTGSWCPNRPLMIFNTFISLRECRSKKHLKQMQPQCSDTVIVSCDWSGWFGKPKSWNRVRASKDPVEDMSFRVFYTHDEHSRVPTTPFSMHNPDDLAPQRLVGLCASQAPCHCLAVAQRAKSGNMNSANKSGLTNHKK